MKKSIAGILIGSALLLPNNTSVEASYSNNNVQVQEVQYIECVGWDGKKFDFSNKKLEEKVFSLFQNNLKISFENYLEAAKFAALKSNDKAENKPAPEVEKTPEAKPAPEVEKTPEAKPVPEVEKTPEAKPVPEVEKTPEAKPAPEVEKTPEAKPAPEVEKTPEAKPAPEVEKAPVTPAPTPAPEKPAKPVESTPNASVSAVEKAVLDLTNAERQKAGLSPLQTDSNLMDSAREKSKDMSSNGYFSHTSPTHGSPFDQMKAHGVSYSSAAENIAMGQRTAEEVVKGWMDSPGHRKNILTADFTHIGIGYEQSGNYWTQQFIKK